MRLDWEDTALKALRDYNIEIYKLANAKHNYSFEVNDTFFSLFESSLISKGSAAIDVELEKTDTFIKLNFAINGSYELTCDRSLDTFDYPVQLREEVVYKFGPEAKEIDDNVFIILKDTQRLNVAQLIYEFLSVSAPMKKLHPRYAGKDDEAAERMIYSSSDSGNAENDEEDIDPRWSKLMNLRNQKDN